MSLRYGHGKPAHAELEKLIQADVYWFDRMVSHIPDYRDILEGKTPINPDFYNSATPCWDCGAIHAMVSSLRPKRWVEVGSGHSTAFAMNSALIWKTGTKFEVVDPAAKDWLGGFPQCSVHQAPVNDVPVETFTSLEAGDILFVGGSHVSNAASDVTIIFLEVLPRLKPGVWVQFHDIFLPDDYPPNWGFGLETQYTEQYMLALLLLMDQGRRYGIELPMYHCLTRGRFDSQIKQLNGIWAPDEDPIPGPQAAGFLSGASFWMRVKP
jgi:hypothetical protein